MQLRFPSITLTDLRFIKLSQQNRKILIIRLFGFYEGLGFKTVHFFSVKQIGLDNPTFGLAAKVI